MLRTAQLFSAFVWTATVASAQGTFTTDGRGCPSPTTDTGPVLYDVLPAGAWHLAHGSLRFTSANGMWSVAEGGEFLDRTAAATFLQLGDEALVGPLDLTFPFAYPGGAGSTTAIDVNSNGRVYLEAGTNGWSAGWSAPEVLPDFLAATPSVCALGTDLNTGADGLLSFEVRTVGPEQVALVTWEGVPEWPDIGSNTFQVQLWSTGEVVLSYREMNGSTAERSALVGVSAGGGAADPGPSRLALPLALALTDGIPVIGDSVTISVRGVPPSATSAVLGLGRPGVAVPVGASAFGVIPDCVPRISPYDELPMLLDPPLAEVTLAWPYDPALVGSTFECQAFVIDPQQPGSNPTLVSDVGTLVVGEPPDLAFVAEGANSFYGSPQHLGSFRLESSPGATHPDVERLEVSFVSVTDYFDVVGNAGLDGQGFFTDGNGQGPACQNAYYGSDVTTGLVYGAPLQGAGCDGSGTTGWVGESPVGGSLTRFRRVVFEFDDFAAGEVFRFDCDTDGGDFHAGAQAMTVTVELSGGATLTAPVVMVADERAEGVLIR